MGLFSLLDSLLDQPLDDVIDAIPIEKEIKLGLLEHSGVLGEILTLVIAYDKAEWDQVDVLTEKLGVIPSITAQFYEDSMVWVEELFGEFR